MINLNPAAATAAPSVLGGVPDAAAGRDFLAMLAGIVGSVTSAASPDGDGVLLPGSPLLGTDGEAAGDLVADLTAELGSMFNAGAIPDGEAADGAEGAFPWPTVQALAAMLAQPAAANAPATDAAAGATGTPDVDATTGAAAPTGPSVRSAADAAVDLAEQLTAMSAAAADDPAAAAATARTTAAAATTATAAATDAAVENASTDRAAAARAATSPATPAAADGAETTSVLDAAADTDAGEPLRVEAPRRGPDADFRPARSGAADTLAEQVQATGEVRETSSVARDRGPMTSAAAGIARVLDAIEMLEKAPPPRQVTLEFGDLRVRVAVEDGAVRMQLLGEQRDAGRDFLRSANEALRERGFEMADDGKGDARDRDADQQRPDLAPPRPERGFGRAGRATDPTTAGVRAGIHL